MRGTMGSNHGLQPTGIALPAGFRTNRGRWGHVRTTRDLNGSPPFRLAESAPTLPEPVQRRGSNLGCNPTCCPMMGCKSWSTPGRSGVLHLTAPAPVRGIPRPIWGLDRQGTATDRTRGQRTVARLSRRRLLAVAERGDLLRRIESPALGLDHVRFEHAVDPSLERDVAAYGVDACGEVFADAWSLDGHGRMVLVGPDLCQMVPNGTMDT